LVDRGADVNVPDGQGMTPLMSAALSGNPEVVRLLLSKGADANASNKKRKGKLTALEIAKFKKNDAIVKLLEESGAKE
jgi:ankyrin repeat protein